MTEIKQEKEIEVNPFAKYQVLSGSALKLIAVITMLIDHTASVLLSKNEIFLFSLAGKAVTLYMIMRLIGRIAFPIYAFLLTEGFVHTHDRKKYGINLFVFALISEIPWNLEHSGKLFLSSQSIYVTLLLGFIGLCIIEKYKSNFKMLTLLSVALIFVSAYASCDYGAKGVTIIMLLYLLRDYKPLQTACGTGLLASSYRTFGVFAGFATILFYNGKRGFIKGKFLKYLFYAIYPIHMLILYLLKKKFIGY